MLPPRYRHKLAKGGLRRVTNVWQGKLSILQHRKVVRSTLQSPLAGALWIPIPKLDERMVVLAGHGFHWPPGMTNAQDENKPVDGTIPVVEEHLRVGKEIVEKDHIRITKSVDNVSEEVPLTVSETAYHIERLTKNQVLSAPPPAVRYEGETMILSVIEEEIVVTKRLKLTEEVRITPVSSQQTDTQQISLRKERVDVERTSDRDNTHSK